MKLPNKAALIAVLSDTSYTLGIVAGLTYELGPIADFFPPKIKAYITAAGISAGYALKLVQRAMERVQGNQDAANIHAVTTVLDVAAADAQTDVLHDAIAQQRELGKLPIKAPVLVFLLASALAFGGCAGLPPRTYSIFGQDANGDKIGASISLGDTRLPRNFGK